MTEHDPDTVSSPTVSRAGDRIHLVHHGNRPPHWLTELAGRLSPVRPGEAVVVVGAPLHEDSAEALCAWLAPSLDSVADA